MADVTYPESFKDYPVSVAEKRSDSTYRSSDWSPRDLLIDLLRRIDSGDIKPDAMVVSYRDTLAATDGGTYTRFSAACPDAVTQIGLFEVGKMKVFLDQ
jgi:hypothetical protein